jgi:hypothetical protein
MKTLFKLAEEIVERFGEKTFYVIEFTENYLRFQGEIETEDEAINLLLNDSSFSYREQEPEWLVFEKIVSGVHIKIQFL